MTKESIQYIIDAEDRATAKFRKTQDSIRQNVREVKDLGDRSSASADLVESLANQLGGGMFADAAGQIAMLSDRMNQFSEVMEAGKGGVLAFKAGLVATAGVIGFEVGKSLGELVFQTESFTKKLQQARSEAKKLGQDLAEAFTRQFTVNDMFAESDEERLRRIGREISSISDRIQQRQKEIDELDRTAFGEIVSPGAKIKDFSFFDLLNPGTSAQSVTDKFNTDLIESKKIAQDQDQQALEILKQQNIELRRQTGERQKAIEAAENAKRLEQERKQQLEQLGKQFGDQIGSAFKRIDQLRKQQADDLKNRLRKEIAASRNELRSLQGSRESTVQSLASSLQAGPSQRFVTGQAASEFKKTEEAILLERQVKQLERAESIAQRTQEILQEIERKQNQIRTVTF